MPPSLQEQKGIVARIKNESAPLDQTIQRLIEEITLIREYRDRLISDVVTGQIDVRAWTPGPDDQIDEADLATLADTDADDETLDDAEATEA